MPLGASPAAAPLLEPLRTALCVVGTGIQWGAQTTLAAQSAMQKADSVLFAVANAWTARWVRSLNPRAQSLAYPRDGRSRAAIYAAMVERIVGELRRHEKVCAVFYGSPAVLAQPAHAAVRRARLLGYGARMLPGVSFLDCLFSDLGLDPGDSGCQVFEARSFLSRGYTLEPRAHLVLCQVALAASRGTFRADSPGVSEGLAALSRRLCAVYPPEHTATLYEASAHPFSPPRADRVRLDELGAARVNEVSTLWVPALATRPHADPASITGSIH